jgi:hypothetical protein
MRRHYLLASFALALLAQGVHAVDRPKTPAGAPVNGEKYILVNANNPTGYMSHTSWDGAFYFLGKDNSNYANHAFTAVKNEDGTWCFTTEVAGAEAGTTVVNYVSIPSGTGNLFIKATGPAYWTVTPGNVNGFYYLKAGAGNGETVQGYNLHLNAGNQYFVISEPVSGGSWYPAYAGGTIKVDETDETTPQDSKGNQADVEGGRAIMADNTSENWAFIHVEDVPEHMAAYGAYQTLSNFEKNYITTAVEGYAAGFQASFDAAVSIYKDAEFNWEEDPEIIMTMLSQKESFYKAIESAKALENPDAALNSAIANAMSTFQTAVTSAEVQGAMTALANAVNAFKEGSGDVTGLGTNMSFEDLSAQSGAVTSGVAAPPFGWTVTIAGVKVETAADVRANGIANWHGVNADCNGAGKDGEYGFGIWTSGVPEYELSQTITGLENGTYVIDAGLMVGANGSGSRRTTQRIFGNLNSTYFASEAEYDLNRLDKSEVYTFANLTEPVTDTEIQNVQVRAYVYDGTLKFGLRTNGDFRAALRSSANGAGGDGWFKTDNFRLTKLGYVGEDAAAVANHFRASLTEFQDKIMQQSVFDRLTDMLSEGAEITATTPAEDINAAIVAYSAFIPEVQASIDAYTKLVNAIQSAYEKSEEFMYYSGFDDYIAVVEEAEAAFDDLSVDPAQIATLIENMDQAFIELQKSGIAVGEYMNIIQNASFEDLSGQGGSTSNGAANPPAGWTLTFNGQVCKTTADYGKAGVNVGWCAINGGDNINVVDENGTPWTNQYTDGTHLWGIWGANMPETELSQSFTGLPAGTYVLSCDMIVEWNWGGENTTTQRIFANDFIQMYGAESDYAAALNDTEDMAAARAMDAANPDADLKRLNFAGHKFSESYGASSAPHPMELKFGVAEDGVLKLGFRTNNVNTEGVAHHHDSSGWFKLDNFKLFYESQDVPTAISNVVAGKSVQLLGQKFYTVDGREIAAPGKGITIVKNIMSDGTVKSVKILK